MFVFALLTAGSITHASPASAATIAATTTCNNAFGNGGAVCEVTVANTITATGGSATVTVRECQGSAGVPDATCTNATSVLTEPVTAVTQCNGSINGGGGVLRCSVTVTNNFVGVSSAPTAVTVNQCVGSGESGAIGATIICDPYPATTSGATITQCNGSGNGGTLVGLLCTASGTQSSALGVTINQCNGSTNGGGTLTVCSATITNNAVVVSPSPTPVATPGAGSTPAAAPPAPPTSITKDYSAATSGASPLVLLGLSLIVALSLFTAFRHFGSRTRR